VKHLQYLKYLLRHKYFVFIAGLRRGVPLWQLIVHDYSKFMPREWLAYCNYFYGTPDEAAFRYAWNYHQKQNAHHWQYWVYPQDDGGLITLEIPEKYRREMLADWDGAGRAITGKWDTSS